MTTVELVKQEPGAMEAQEVASKIKTALATGRKALWELAEALYAFDEMRGWRDLGYTTLSAWLEDTDEQITRGTYYRLVQTWRKVVVELEVESERLCLLDQSKVAIVAGSLTEAEVKVDDALADVKALSAQDLREKYGPAKRKNAKVAAKTAPRAPEKTGDDDETSVPSDHTPAQESTVQMTRRDELGDRLEELAALTSSLVAPRDERSARL